MCGFVLRMKEPHINTCYKHFYYFVCEFELIEKKELEPLVSLSMFIAYSLFYWIVQHVYIHHVSKKARQSTFGLYFGKCKLIAKFCHWQIPTETLCKPVTEISKLPQLYCYTNPKIQNNLRTFSYTIRINLFSLKLNKNLTTFFWYLTGKLFHMFMGKQHMHVY